MSSLMQNLIRRGATWYGRIFIPKDRWADVGKAMGAANGVKREVVRTLQTDRQAGGEVASEHRPHGHAGHHRAPPESRLSIGTGAGPPIGVQKGPPFVAICLSH